MIKQLADWLKITKAACTLSSKSKQNVRFISDNLKSISCRRLETKRCSVRNVDFGFRRKAQVRTYLQLNFICPYHAKETPKGRGGKVKPYKSGHSLVPPSAHILSYGFSMPCKRQALISSLPSHPHQARFYRCVLSFLFVSCIEYCFVPFTAAPLICGLAFRYRVSAVCFA